MATPRSICLPSVASGQSAALLRRVLLAWLATLGLLLQLASAGACGKPAGMVDQADAVAPFPICHAAPAKSDDGGAPHAPSSGESCPLCSVHCHGVVAPPPAFDLIARTPAGVDAAPAVTVATSVVVHRPCTAASPRGPPAVL